MYGLSHLDTFAKPFTLTFTLAATLALTALLAACGGGGGGTSPAPVVTYTSATTCAGGLALTSTIDQATANALVPASCPAMTTAQLAAVTVTRSAASPNTIAVSGLPADWTLTGGTATFTPIAPTTGAAVTGSISAAGVITPNGTLPAGTTASSYTVAANLTFANAPATAVSSTIVVPAVVNATLLAAAKALIVPYNVQKVVMTTQLAPSITLVTDDGFLQGVANGDVLLMDVGIRQTGTIDAARDLVYAIYRQNGNHYIKALFKDDLSGATLNNSLVAALWGAIHDRYMGSANGLLYREWNPSYSQSTCYLSNWQAVNFGFGNSVSTACPTWI